MNIRLNVADSNIRCALDSSWEYKELPTERTILQSIEQQMLTTLISCFVCGGLLGWMCQACAIERHLQPMLELNVHRCSFNRFRMLLLHAPVWCQNIIELNQRVIRKFHTYTHTHTPANLRKLERSEIFKAFWMYHTRIYCVILFHSIAVRWVACERVEGKERKRERGRAWERESVGEREREQCYCANIASF